MIGPLSQNDSSPSAQTEADKVHIDAQYKPFSLCSEKNLHDVLVENR